MTERPTPPSLRAERLRFDGTARAEIRASLGGWHGENLRTNHKNRGGSGPQVGLMRVRSRAVSAASAPLRIRFRPVFVAGHSVRDRTGSQTIVAASCCGGVIPVSSSFHQQTTQRPRGYWPMCLRSRSTNVDCVRIGRPSSGNLPPSLPIFVLTNAWRAKSFVGNGLRTAMRKGCPHRAGHQRRIRRERWQHPSEGGSRRCARPSVEDPSAHRQRQRTWRQAPPSRRSAAVGGHKAASIVGEIGEPVLASNPAPGRARGPA